MFRFALVAIIATFSFSLPAHAQMMSPYSAETEFDPYDPNAEQYLEEFDSVYERETGESPFSILENVWAGKLGDCREAGCPLWILVNRSTQKLSLYINGAFVKSWAVSTGLAPRITRAFETHPDGRIYSRYTSNKFPGGDYKGLGNMPYAVFIRGGFALHGTPQGNWSKLGRPASHGCIRQHPDNARYLNQLVRQYGARQTWISVR